MQTPSSPGLSNRLINETSPYLRQHAHQPVNWYPWCDEALKRARRENKPIFISIGYSACHWCHVMAHESFENDAIARLINENFVPIKVDREERPDLDAVYMNVCVALNGSGGWPLNVFTTPDLDPIFAGTYFPPHDAYGRPGFTSLLKRIAELWRENPEELRQQARTLTQEIQRLLRVDDQKEVHSDSDAASLLLRTAEGAFDPFHGGFGRAPKFPSDTLLAALLGAGVRSNDPRALDMVEKTLDAMAFGGIYDQIGGGFARYCVDEEWTVPHFEKMLYTQALLVPLYLDAYVVLGKVDYARVAAQTLDWVLTDLLAPEGGFYAAQDADSEGEEGKYYLWTSEELKEILEDDADVQLASEYFCVTPTGNFENGKCVLRRGASDVEFAGEWGLTIEELRERVEKIRQKLLSGRARRVPPLTDDKIILGWNALMISALVRSTQVLGDTRYLDAARRAVEFLLSALRPSPGVLSRVYCKGRSSHRALLEDYAYLCQALLDLYEQTLADEYLLRAEDLAREAVEKFADVERNHVFSAEPLADLIYRPEDAYDNALPSAPAVLFRVLNRLDIYREADEWTRFLSGWGSHLEGKMWRAPLASGSLFLVWLMRKDGPTLFTLSGDPTDSRFAQLHQAVLRTYDPLRVVRRFPMPKDRELSQQSGEAGVTLCARQACFAPVSSPEKLAALLHEQHIPFI